MSNQTENGHGFPARPCSADLLRSEAERIRGIREKADKESDHLSALAWALNISAAWLDSMSAPERQTRFLRCDLPAGEEIGRLRRAAQAVVDRWNSPLWKDVGPTAEVIYKLRDLLPNVRRQVSLAGGKGESQGMGVKAHSGCSAASIPCA